LLAMLSELRNSSIQNQPISVNTATCIGGVGQCATSVLFRF
jgi:hypothetical protein